MLLFCIVFLIFCFFKQKTAYEMRISDWSSDVCSSDLLERNGPINRFLQALGLTDQPLPLLFNDTGVVIGMVHVLLPYAILPLYAAMVRIDRRLLLASDGLGAKIGRASCWERVCTYV